MYNIFIATIMRRSSQFNFSTFVRVNKLGGTDVVQLKKLLTFFAKCSGFDPTSREQYVTRCEKLEGNMYIKQTNQYNLLNQQPIEAHENILKHPKKNLTGSKKAISCFYIWVKSTALGTTHNSTLIRQKEALTDTIVSRQKLGANIAKWPVICNNMCFINELLCFNFKWLFAIFNQINK